MSAQANGGFRTLEMSDPRFEAGGLRQLVVKSRALKRRADITLFVPAKPARRLLILLHGVYGSHWSWTARTGVHRLAQRLIEAGEIEPMILAMPSDGLWGDGSAYLPQPGENTGRGPNQDAEQWIVKEVIEATALAVPELGKQRLCSLAGLSMGGYGALRLGAKYADRFESVSAHSAITELAQMEQFVEEPLDRYFESSSSREELEPWYWMERNRASLPRLRFDCGTSDELVNGNRKLHAQLEAAGIAHTYEELEGGHEWSYWEQNVVRTLRFVGGR